MNVRFINIIVVLDIVVRICRDHSGKRRDFWRVREEFFIDRCIRERNCGTGYQVDPVTQTCVGKRDIFTRKFDCKFNWKDVDECEQDIDECR